MKRTGESALAVKTLSHADITYKLSERLALSDAQEAVRLKSMKDLGDAEDKHSAGSYENRNEPAEYMS